MRREYVKCQVPPHNPSQATAPFSRRQHMRAVGLLSGIGAALAMTGCNVILAAFQPSPTDAGPAEQPVSTRFDAGLGRTPDTTPPVVTITQPEADCLGQGPVTFRFSVKDDQAGVGFVSARFGGIDIDTNEEGDGIWRADTDITTNFDGIRTLTVLAIDTENNQSETKRNFGVVVTPGGYVHNAVVIDGGQTDPNNTEFECGAPPPPPLQDSQPPHLTITSPAPQVNIVVGTSLALTVTATDDVGPLTVVATVGATSATLTGIADSYSGTLDLSTEAEGSRTLIVTATDAAAHVTQVERAVRIDQTPPAVAITDPPAGSDRAAFTDVAANATDDNGVVRVQLFESGQELGAATSPQDGTTDGYGVIYCIPCAGLPRAATFEMRATDRAGNVGSDTVDVTLNTIGCDAC